VRKGGLRNRRAALLAVALGAVGLALAAYATNLLRAPELKSLDARYSIRGPVKPPKNIVIVAIDEQTLK
jgi:CHASE2 domain-containing sensor protein